MIIIIKFNIIIYLTEQHLNESAAAKRART